MIVMAEPVSMKPLIGLLLMRQLAKMNGEDDSNVFVVSVSTIGWSGCSSPWPMLTGVSALLDAGEGFTLIGQSLCQWYAYMPC